MEDNDISKRTVLVLLILTLIISVVGTWTILSQPAMMYRTETKAYAIPGGSVGVNILGSEPAKEEPVVLDSESNGGRVGINILK